MYINKKMVPKNVKLEKSIFSNYPYQNFYSNIILKSSFMGFFFEISFSFIEMLSSEAEATKKIFVIELSVSSLV